jgi:sugar lactone lactonase YvrE
VGTTAHTTAVACDAVGGIRPVCGFRNPEDLVVVPGGEALLVSEMAPFMSEASGALSVLILADERRMPVGIAWEAGEEVWGEPDCPAPRVDRFSPHGIDLVTRGDGRHELLVVNHGDERVEFFELLGAAADLRLQWRGCANPPGDPFINDVAGLPGGGFVATHMWDKSVAFDEVVRRLTGGEATGWVWQWLPDGGFSKLPGSDDLMPNGIAVSGDGSKVFVNVYMGNRTVRFDRATGAREAEFEVRSPDNVVMGEDGHLWVASHLNDPIEGRCPDDHPGPCLLPFRVVRADPETMQAEVVLEHDGEPMGYATVALPHAGRVYLGTASGDRIASFEPPASEDQR